MSVNKIAIFGAGGFGREVKMMIDQINETFPKWEFVGYFDDGVAKGSLINGLPVLGNSLDLLSQSAILHVVFAIGNPIIKKDVIEKVGVNTNLIFPTLIHPSALIGKDWVSIGEGTIIAAGNIITTNIAIGKHVILNLSCTVGHDTKISDFCSIMPGVNISGEVLFEECVYVGTGAKIINQVTVGARTVIGAGAVVSKSYPSDLTLVGIPAKPLSSR